MKLESSRRSETANGGDVEIHLIKELLTPADIKRSVSNLPSKENWVLLVYNTNTGREYIGSGSFRDMDQKYIETCKEYGLDGVGRYTVGDS